MRLQKGGTKTHLQPLGLVAVECCPGVGFARLVQASIMGVPGKGVDAPRLEDAGGCDLLVGDEARFHAQRLRATCRVEIHCNTMVYTGGEKERVHGTVASKTPVPAGAIPPFPLPRAAGSARQGKVWQRKAWEGKAWQSRRAAASRFLPGFLAPSYSLAHSASCCRLRNEAEEDAFAGEESNARTSPDESRAGTAPTQWQDTTQAPAAPHSHRSTRARSAAWAMPQGRNAGGTEKGLKLIIPHVSQRTLILQYFSTSLQEKPPVHSSDREGAQ